MIPSMGFGVIRHVSPVCWVLPSSSMLFSRAVDIQSLDSQNIFEKVPHRRLMNKVLALRLSEGIENLLFSIEGIVGMKLNWATSRQAPVHSGVPQVSTISLFCWLSTSMTKMQGCCARLPKAQTIQKKNGAVVSSYNGMERLLDSPCKLMTWPEAWQTSFNLDKCKPMHISHTSRKESYSLSGERTREIWERSLAVIESSLNGTLL